MTPLIHRVLFAAIAFSTLLPQMSASMALTLGLAFGMSLGNPCLPFVRRWTPALLQASVVGLGGAINLATVAAVGLHGVIYTAVGISLSLIVGLALARLFRTERGLTLLLSAGTAICGGSAIAAVAPMIRAKDYEVSVALAVVFLLNAAALLLFPWLGHLTGLSETQFGLWSALAIHDTSSVVGASLQYGPRALEVATTVKLARALWIVPLTFAIGAMVPKTAVSSAPRKAKRPWFILGFIALAAVATWVPQFALTGQWIAAGARRSLVFTLFLIGSGLSREDLQNIGPRAFLHGAVLWLVVGTASYFAVAFGRIGLS